ncbi:MAG: radical SAM family heme chaperone HemW [Coriobacteriales bacterium]|nr:radical SAM family heme chaperone HemW [Coriobacteriales bacterium]
MSAMSRLFSALYLHIPFCVKRCAYCDFATEAVPRGSERIDDFVERMVISIRRAAKAGLLSGLETIYIGGGTPTHIGLSKLSEILYILSLSKDIDASMEVTMEANPESLTEQIVKDARALGVNRLSIGVQSLDDGVLETLGRAHGSKRAIEAIQLATSCLDNVSADVICGVMGQSDESLVSTIEQLVGLGVTHVSVYPLTIEEGTPLCAIIEAGQLPEVDEDAQARHMELAAKTLQAHGFTRYEVASYALPGRESRHNSAYWTGKPYLGLGYGAASMLDSYDLGALLESGALDCWAESIDFEGLQERAAGSHRTRISLARGGLEAEFLSERESACEDAMLGLRMSRGLPESALSRLTDACPELAAAIDEALTKGLAQLNGDGSVSPTAKGWLLGNELYGLVWDCAR